MCNIRVNLLDCYATLSAFDFRSFFCSRHLINITDTDKDGKSSVDELTTWNHEAAKERFVEEAKERLLDMDKNKDGKVSFEEYDKSQQKISRGQ